MAETFGFEQEVRLAVVMYGGVSLAIYMNGVTQELLNLVRATAPATDGSDKLLHQKAESTEAVYRDLAKRLKPGELATTGDVTDADPVRCRFMIDLLSGTSAGGINAIFLAKALALDRKLDNIRILWMEQAGIENLINDKRSLKGTPLQSQQPPESLLNGERLYLKLLEAFDQMDGEISSDRSPYVDDALDLYVTATDIIGLGLPLRLQFQQVQERRHKNVFHAQYRAMPDGKMAPLAAGAWPVPQELSKGSNQFNGTNPFLAFAARCTSSFPFAFEPMTLERAGTLCKASGRNVNVKEMSETFFEDYVQAAAFDPAGNPLPFEQVPFGDGGYLDNKPFGHVIDALDARASSLPAVRKLLYVEPSPEQQASKRKTDKITFVDNVVAAAFTLPTYETIREDVQRVGVRNRRIERVRRINTFVEDDLENWTRGETKGWKVMSTTEWRASTAPQMVDHYGPGYGGYQRLRLSAATDQLAGFVTTATGLNRTSNNFMAVRELIRAWRNLRYTDKAPGRTFNEFLLRFDTQYPLRRLTFVRTRLNDMAKGEVFAMALCKKINPSWPDEPAKDAGENARQVYEGLRKEFCKEIGRIKGEVAYLYRRLEREFDRLASVNGPVAKALSGEEAGADIQLGLDERLLAALRAEPTDESLQRRAETFVNSLQDDFEEVDARVYKLIAEIDGNYEKAYETLRASTSQASTSLGIDTARKAFNRLYDNFEAYDLLIFPALAMSDVGEPVRTDIIRISPLESSALGGPPENPRLAGTKLFSFGAFLERHWRENDMLWGRLQGAEQIITAFMPRQPEEKPEMTATRAKLIERAHLAILNDMIKDNKAGIIGRLIRHATQHVELAQKKDYVGPPLDMAALRQLFESCLTPEQLREHYAECFKLDESVDPPSALRNASRSSIVVGKMLDGVSDHVKSATTVVIRAGRLLWGTVEVSVPGSIWRKVFLHWSAVLLIAAALLIVVGTLAEIKPAPRVGWLVIILVVGANVASALARLFFERRGKLLRGFLTLLGTGIVALAVYGGWTIWHNIAHYVQHAFAKVGSFFS